LRGIKKAREMAWMEHQEQLRALRELLVTYDRGHRFRAEDLRHMHRNWLGGIYAWAGEYRQVNLSKGDFPFAAAAQIPKLMSELEAGPLKEYTPCRFTDESDAVRALAVVHTELVLIHPFREGNGRLARMLATLMALQAGIPPLDFGGMVGKQRQEYFAAVRAGLDRDYRPMERIFSLVLRRTRRTEGGA
jgi:cell filamentation protein